MTTEILLVLAILGVAILLFVSERLRVDLVAMLVLIALVLTGLVTAEEAFSGFTSPAVVRVARSINVAPSKHLLPMAFT